MSSRAGSVSPGRLGRRMEAATATSRPAELEAVAPFEGAGPLDRVRSDDRLVARFRAGDDSAFAALYQRHRPRVLAICLAVLGSHEDAQDAMQEVFASAARSLRRRPPDELRPWLARVARNAAIDMLRARQPTCSAAEEPIAPAAADGRLELRDLLAALRALPEQQRTALVMRELAGFSYSEIAATLGTDETAVNGLIARARLGLRSREAALAVGCTEVRARLAAETDGRRRPAELRRHLRACGGCRDFRASLRVDTKALRALFPGGGFGLWQLAALWRAPKAAVFGSVLAKGAAGSQAAKLAAVCAACLGAAGGVGGLALAPRGGPEGSEAGRGSDAAGRPATATHAHERARSQPDGWRVGLESVRGLEQRRLERLRRLALRRLRGLEPGTRSWERALERWTRQARGPQLVGTSPGWDPQQLRVEALKAWEREQPAPQPTNEPPSPESPSHWPSSQAPTRDGAAQPEYSRPERSRPEPAPRHPTLSAPLPERHVAGVPDLPLPGGWTPRAVEGIRLP